MSDPQHAPRPWHAGGPYIFAASGQRVVEVLGELEEVGRRRDVIIRAVNAHDELLAAMPNTHTLRMLADAPGLHVHPELHRYLHKVADAIDAAIAKVPGATT